MKKSNNKLQPPRDAFEARVDDLEKRLKEKVEVSAGFADIEVRARKLEKCFKYFDTNDSKLIDYTEFFAAMTKLNFVGCQREIEALFNKYDEVFTYILFISFYYLVKYNCIFFL
jgi:Ca2+-binding EF-hand superfamily protein